MAVVVTEVAFVRTRCGSHALFVAVAVAVKGVG